MEDAAQRECMCGVCECVICVDIDAPIRSLVPLPSLRYCLHLLPPEHPDHRQQTHPARGPPYTAAWSSSSSSPPSAALPSQQQHSSEQHVSSVTSTPATTSASLSTAALVNPSALDSLAPFSVDQRIPPSLVSVLLQKSKGKASRGPIPASSSPPPPSSPLPGPLSLVRRLCVDGIRARVVTRCNDRIDGISTGLIRAFDKHLNLVTLIPCHTLTEITFAPTSPSALLASTVRFSECLSTMICL